MSLIKCNECEKKISSNAFKCTKCGITTEYGKKIIRWCTIILFVVAFIIIIIVDIKSNNNELVGEWFSEEIISVDGFIERKIGKKINSYSFDSDGKCVESETNEGETIVKQDNIFLNRKVGDRKKYSESKDNLCKYKIKNGGKTFEIFYYEFYEEDLNDYNDCLNNPDEYDVECSEIKYPKDDYIDEFDLSITENNIFIDGKKYERKKD